jgi:DNA-binding HxlR family transcriptional regulator
MIDLTPSQTQGLKLAKAGDLHPVDGKKWTHLNAEVTYAKHDRFKERPQKIKSLTAATLRALVEHGFVKALTDDKSFEESAYSITKAGKMWLMLTK